MQKQIWFSAWKCRKANSHRPLSFGHFCEENHVSFCRVGTAIFYFTTKLIVLKIQLFSILKRDYYLFIVLCYVFIRAVVRVICLLDFIYGHSRMKSMWNFRPVKRKDGASSLEFPVEFIF